MTDGYGLRSRAKRAVWALVITLIAAWAFALAALWVLLTITGHMFPG